MKNRHKPIFPISMHIIVLLKMKNGAFAPFYSWLIVRVSGNVMRSGSVAARWQTSGSNIEDSNLRFWMSVGFPLLWSRIEISLVGQADTTVRICCLLLCFRLR